MGEFPELTDEPKVQGGGSQLSAPGTPEIQAAGLHPHPEAPAFSRSDQQQHSLPIL